MFNVQCSTTLRIKIEHRALDIGTLNIDMNFPFTYDHGAPMAFGGAMPTMRSFDDSRAVILPVPVDRTTSYVSGTRNGPREIIEASSHMELWDEEIGADVHDIGIYTLPPMELPFGEMAPLMDEIRRVASEILSRGKFLVSLGGEHSITPPLVEAAASAFKLLRRRYKLFLSISFLLHRVCVVRADCHCRST